jgi:hypothetical protein
LYFKALTASDIGKDMSTEKVEGIVERCGASLAGHGDHGFILLLKGMTKIYNLPGVRDAYATVFGRSAQSNDLLVSLTRAGDHVSFEFDYGRVKAGTFRNWTLEARLLGHPEHDVTPRTETKAITDQA